MRWPFRAPGYNPPRHLAMLASQWAHLCFLRGLWSHDTYVRIQGFLYRTLRRGRP